MDNAKFGIRASGLYATYRGCEYFAHRVRDRVRLLSDDDPLPNGFRLSTKKWILGEVVVNIADIDRLTRITTTCHWRAHQFKVGIIVGDLAYVTYLGKDFDEVGRYPGMERPDKFEVIGEIKVPELTQIMEEVVQIPLGHKSDDARRGTRKGD
jgi:hypothetical protein